MPDCVLMFVCVYAYMNGSDRDVSKPIDHYEQQLKATGKENNDKGIDFWDCATIDCSDTDKARG